MLRILLLHVKPLLRTALRGGLNLLQFPITLGELGLLPKRLWTTSNRSLSELERKRGELFVTIWREVEKQRLKALVKKIEKSFVVSEKGSLKRLIAKMK